MTNTIASDTLVEAIARAIIDGLADFAGDPRVSDAEWSAVSMVEGRELSEAQAQAVLHAIDGAGFVLAPREPTEAMLEAHALLVCEARLKQTLCPTAAYRAMIDAVTHCNHTNNGKAE